MTVLDRFLKYVAVDTTSDENSVSFPSTPDQLVLLSALKDELKSFGLDAKMDEYGYVTALVPGNVKGKGRICFISHVDTSPAVSGKVRPQVIDYGGGDVLLKDGAVITVADNPELKGYVGEKLVTSDGTSLLGADDKAGVAEIMSMVETLVNDPSIKHGDVLVGFTPDEEIGRGVDHFDVAAFGADFGYTVDGGLIGEIEYENFNAAAATLTVTGKSIHPGSAKNRMKNAIDLFCEFHDLLPVAERPVNTENYEGFYMADEMSGGVEKVVCKYIIRDHDMVRFEAKKKFFSSAAAFLNSKYGDGTFSAEITDSYYNMAEIIAKNFHLIESAKTAMKRAGVEPVVIPIRGGTDGARLSFMGLPCPNLSTGGANFHARNEYVPVFALEKMVRVLLNIVDIYS